MFNKAISFLTQNKSAVLIGVAVGGVVTTAFAAGESAIKADKVIREMEYTYDHTPTVKEKAKVIFPIMIKPAIMGGLTIGCIVYAHKLDVRKQLALGSALALSEAAKSDVDDILEKTLGKEKSEKAKKESIEKHIESNDDILDLAKGEQLFWEPITGRAFKSTEGDIKGAYGDICKLMYGSDGASLNDLFDILGLENADVGDVLGWNTGLDDPPEYSVWETRKIQGRSYLVLNLEFGNNVHILRSAGC